MRLKFFTTTCLVFGIVMMMAYPWIIGVKPTGPGTDAAAIQYATRVLVYVTIILVCFLLSIFGAYLVMRQNRAEFREKTLENLQNLLEATMKDHEKRN